MPEFFKTVFKRGNLIKIVVMVLLYVLLGNMSSIQKNPIVPGAIVAVNMIIIVLAGILKTDQFVEIAMKIKLKSELNTISLNI